MLTVRVISSNKTKKEQSKGVTREEFDYRMDMLELKTDQLERKLSRKADDIVSVQLLQHRQELEEIYQAIKNIDGQIKEIELELDKFSTNAVAKTTKVAKPKKNLRILHT